MEESVSSFHSGLDSMESIVMLVFPLMVFLRCLVAFMAFLWVTRAERGFAIMA